MYYDKTGKPISQHTWTELFTEEYKRVLKDDIKDFHISTVWLGIDHSFNSPKPLIFETMIFHRGRDCYMDRYSTLKEAMEGHKSMKEKIEKDDYSDLDLEEIKN